MAENWKEKKEDYEQKSKERKATKKKRIEKKEKREKIVFVSNSNRERSYLVCHYANSFFIITAVDDLKATKFFLILSLNSNFTSILKWRKTPYFMSVL